MSNEQDERTRLCNNASETQREINLCPCSSPACRTCHYLREHLAELNAQIEALDHYEDVGSVEDYGEGDFGPVPSLDIDIDYLIKKAKRHAATLDSERCEELLFKITQAKAAFAEAVADAMEVAQ